MIDVYQSRRTNYIKCRYWIAKNTEAFRDFGNQAIRRDDGYHISEYCDGMFYAREITGESEDNRLIENVILVKKSEIQLETTDNISSLIVNSIVEYDNYYWRVGAIQKIKKKKQSQFLRKTSYKYIVSLIR